MRTISRHAYRSDESYRGVDAGPRRSPGQELSRRAAVLSVALAALLPGLLMAGWLVMVNQAFWAQPDVAVTIIASRADGVLPDGRNECDASRFTVAVAVADADGRQGTFRDCTVKHAVGDVTTARWSRSRTDLVSVDVMDPGPIAGFSTGLGALIGLIAASSVRAERRREKRRRINTYRVREEPAES